MKSINKIFFSLLSLVLLAFVGCGGGGPSSKSRQISKQDTATAYIDKADFDPIINVYLENSGSMDGYVKGQSDFKHIVYGLLSDLKITKISTQPLNLYYINSELLPQPDDLEDFINKLSPDTFKKKGGKRGVSDLAEMMKLVFNDLNNETVSIFVSDCIFSPGKGKDAKEYLNSQSITIKEAVAMYYNEHPKIAIRGYRCLSSFDGLYYDKNDAGNKWNGTRPFYIWIFGTQGAIKRIDHELGKNGYQIMGVENKITLFGGGIELPDSLYAIKRNSGRFELDRQESMHTINSLKKDERSGKIKFEVNVNYYQLLLDNEYVCDTTMYKLSDSHYQVTQVKQLSQPNKFTHTLTIEADAISPTTLYIDLLQGYEKWSEVFNDEMGGPLDSSNEGKTFGIDYLVKGFAGGILRSPYYTRMRIKINN